MAKKRSIVSHLVDESNKKTKQEWVSSKETALFYELFVIGSERTEFLAMIPMPLLQTLRLLDRRTKTSVDSFLLGKMQSFIASGDVMFLVKRGQSSKTTMLKSGTTCLAWAIKHRFSPAVFVSFTENFLDKNELLYTSDGRCFFAKRTEESHTHRGSLITLNETPIPPHNNGSFIGVADMTGALDQRKISTKIYGLNASTLVLSPKGTILLQPIKKMTTKIQVVHVYAYKGGEDITNTPTFGRDISVDVEPDGIVRIYDKSGKTNRQLCFHYPIFFGYTNAVVTIKRAEFRFPDDRKMMSTDCDAMGCPCPKYTSHEFKGSGEIDYIITLDLQRNIRINSYLHPETWGSFTLPKF